MSMRTQQESHHLIDFLFPAALLFVFAFSAVSVILLATDVYQDTVAHSARSYTAETALSYLTEKLHQSDTSGEASIGSFDGCEALVLKASYNGTAYTTYLYSYEDQLWELFVKDGTAASATDGKAILPVTGLTMETLSPSLFSFSCENANGETVTSVVNLRSNRKGGAS